MAGPCPDDFAAMADELGFSCADVQPLVNVRNPLGLENWTLPVVEALLVSLAIAAAVHAVRRWRAGDVTPSALWLGSVVYLLVMEPPVYFPAQFGIADHLKTAFVHNVFTVEFMFDRMPLYILCLYPAMAVLSYESVRSLGVFRRRGVLIGAVCVGFVHHCFYEIFDQLGPQLRWWAWNPDEKNIAAVIGSAPVSSVFMFATVGPAALTYLVRTLVTDRPARGGLGVLGGVVLSGVLTTVVVLIAGIPGIVAGMIGGDPDTTAQTVVMMALVAVFAAVALSVLPTEWRRNRSAGAGPGEGGHSEDDTARPYAVAAAVAYCVVFAVLWASELPGLLSGSVDERLAANVPYTLACFVLVIVFTAAVATGGRVDAPREPAVESETV
ncbi:hypothetical protein GII33_13755 [Gordonia pseudamarae]|jgi:hypothetical protein|uniref:Integral membrane protein n=1 Tax=Gordonia pseudamarae TaxID=2831662 RepID=A0ABX6IKB0_9ACTN|nr:MULTISPECIES: hypothetical protein [Gordonia]MBD0022575.1 hypothetical protein [Gordonia sp. (in: high G+C Gram-positive bacteria)]QHN26859.1 hypothetical protein GII33_13755 [Gordonia pseudamarae]QHN35750.1 hypothetical protein GII31_13580 [Gordonia pseudamarae]